MNRFVASIPAANPVAPNVALFWQSVSVDSRGALRQTATFDIVANEVEAGEGFRNRVAQGVADTVVERAMLGDAALGINPAYLYAQDLSAGRHWTMLGPGDHGRVEHLGFAPDAAVRVADDLARGSMVIARDLSGASTPGERAAWWRIDPRSGVTLGMGENGRGPEMAEEAMDELLMNLGICGYMLLGPAVVKVVVGAPMFSESNIATFAVCLGLGAAGYASSGTWLAPGVELYDWVLRVFEAYETAEAANNPHGE
jgi:hypothetical protein